MSEASVIREFLVSLGYKVSDSDKFEAAIKRATTGVLALADAVEAAATAVTTMTVVSANKLEGLYYASKKFASSANDIEAWSQAMRRVGLSAGDAMDVLNKIQTFMNSTPAAGGILSAYGISSAGGATGIARQLAERITEMTKQGMKPWQIQQRMGPLMGALGLSQDQILALGRGPDVDAQRRRIQAMGVDYDKLAAQSQKFSNDWRDFTMMLTADLDKILSRVMPVIAAVTKFLEGADKATHGWSTALLLLASALAPVLTVLGPILKVLGPIAEVFGSLGALLNPVVLAVVALAGAIAFLVKDFNDWKSGAQSFIPWDQWAPVIDAAVDGFRSIADALGQVGAAVMDTAKVLIGILAPVFGPIVKLIWEVDKALFALAGSFLASGLKQVIAEAASWLHGLANGIKFVADAVKVLKDLLQNNMPQAAKDAHAAATDLAKSYAQQSGAPVDTSGLPSPSITARNAALAARGGAKVAGYVGGGVAVISGLSDRVRSFFQANGFSAEQAKGIAAGINAESRTNAGAVNPTSGAFGLGQWLGDRKRKLFAMFGPNPNFDQQLQFMLYELTGGDSGGRFVRGAGSAAQTMKAYLARFMRPGGGLAGDLNRGYATLAGFDRVSLGGHAGAGVHMAQKTDIHVHGGGDATTTAKAVAAQQSRVNGDMVRNLKVAAS